MAACGFLGSTFWNRDLPENIASALIVGARVDSGPFHIPKKNGVSAVAKFGVTL